MREFELNRTVDTVSVMANNSSIDGARPMALYVPVAALPVIVTAYAYVLVGNQVTAAAAYWIAAGYKVAIANEIRVY